MKDFAHIRTIAGRQVLAYTEMSNDGMFLHIHYRLKNETNVGQRAGSFEEESDLDHMFNNFVGGGMDKSLAKQIKKFEKTIKVTRCKE